MKPKFIFDLSEVLIAGLVGIEIPLAAFIDLPKDEILRSFAGQLLEDICCGKILEDVYLEQIIHNQKWDVSVGMLKDCIRTNFHHEIEGTTPIFRRLANKYDVVLLSDHAVEWVTYIQTIHPFIRKFKRTFSSYALGTTKKNPETFIKVLQTMSYKADECWLIDDSSRNIEVAASVGINGIHFQNAKQLNTELSQVGF